MTYQELEKILNNPELQRAIENLDERLELESLKFMLENMKTDSYD